jgi:hypothetical protein
MLMLRRFAPTIVSIVVLGGVAASALLAEREASSSPAVYEPEQVQAARGPSALPPDHPPIEGHETEGPREPSSEGAAVEWTVPAGWEVVSTNTGMRLATYRIGPQAEMSVVRAGGSTDANIERWLGQFDEAGLETRATREVRGLKVTIVEVSGTYLGSGMGTALPAPQQGYALLGAIVETSGSPYFFKLVGPEAAVKAARARFDELVASVRPLAR